MGVEMHMVYLGLGTNLGDKEKNILKACEMLRGRVGETVRQSSLYRTKPWGFTSDNDFVNAAVCCQTTLTPQQVLTATQEIERDMGRTVKSVDGQYHDRIIDIDILLYDDISINEPNLTIPHPLMKERDFVMNPLNEILQ